MNKYLLGVTALASSFLLPTLSLAQTLPSVPAAPANVAAAQSPVTLPMNLIMQVREGAEVRVASGAVGRDQALVSIPFRYRRTAELTADLLAAGGWRGNQMVMLKAGAKGYWAGRFRSQLISTTTYGGVPIRSSPGAVSQTEIWCFFGVDDRNREASACVQQLSDGSAQLVTTGNQPYLLQSFSSSPSNQSVSQFQFVEKPLELFPDLRMEYRFREWDARDLDVHLVVRDTLVENLPSLREADGTALVATPAGTLRLRQNGTDRRTATVTLETAPIRVSQPAPAPETASADLRARMLLMAEMADRRARMLDREQPLRAHVLSLAQVDAAPRTVQRGEVVARQTIRPVKAFTQDATPLGRPERFGAPGTLLFEVPWNDEPPVLCWRNPEQLTSVEPANHNNYTVKSFCLQDIDRNGSYEVLWKDPQFIRGARYALAGLETRTALDGGQKPPITVRSADASLLAPETIELVYVGVTEEGIGAGGTVVPKAVGFNWRYASFPLPTSASSTFLVQGVSVSEKGDGKYTSSSRDFVTVSGVTGNGQAQVQILGLYPLGDQLLSDPAERAARFRALAKSIRESKEVTGADPAAPAATTAVPSP
jgi:hypothetical protein